MHLLRTLGQLRLEQPDGTDAGGRRMILALLAWLARQRHREASRERLVSVLWERQDVTAGRHSLRQALSELRSLSSGLLLDTDPDRVALAPGIMELDADRFEREVASRDWQAALQLYRGEFLSGLEDLGGEEWRSWLEGERASLRRQADAAWTAAIQETNREAAWARGVELAEQWTAMAPGDDRPVVALIRALLAASRPAEASGRHAGHLERLRSEGREPDPEFIRLAGALKNAPLPGRARGLLSPDLVGRQEPFARLSAAWDAVTGGDRGQVIVIEADDGMGKTRLLDEFARWVRASPRPGFVVEARSPDGDSDQAWRELSGILDRLDSAPGIAATPSADLAELARISPRLRQRYPQLDGGTQDPGGALVRMLAEVGQEQPVLLVLDDADRTDPGSARALATLAEHPPARVLFVLSARPGRLPGGPLGPALKAATAAARHVRLLPLDAATAVQFVSSMGPIDPAAACAIGEAAVEDLGGAPATIYLLVTDLVDQGVLRQGPTGRLELAAPLHRPLALPELLRDHWARLARGLRSPLRALLHLVAVSPGPAGADGLARAASLEAEVFQDAIGDLLARRLIRRSPAGEVAFECANEALRHAILDTLPPHRKAQLRAALAGTDATVQRRRTRRVAMAGILVLAVGLGIAWGFRPPPLPAGELQILVADVRTDDPGDEDLARPLLLAATTELQEVAGVRPAPRSLVRDVVVRMGRPGADTLLDEPLAMEVAAREGIELVALLEVDRDASGRHLRFRLLEAATGNLLDAGSARVPSDADVLPALSRLLRELRSALGAASTSVGDAEGYPRLSTHSLAAVKHYTAGTQAWTARAYAVAQREWEQAVALDSGFALAWASLAGEAFRVQNQPRGRDHLARARAHADRLSPRERLQLEATAARWLGTSAEAVAAARTLATQYPDRDTWYNLGTTLMRLQRCTEALPALRRTTELDPHMAAAHVNIATCFQFLQQYDSAEASYHLARVADSTILRTGNIGIEYGMVLRMLRRDGEAARHYEEMRGWGPDWNRGLGTRQLAWMAMARGQYRRAASLAGGAVGMQEVGNSPLGAFRDRMLRARALMRAGSPQSVAELRAAWSARPDSLVSIELLWPFVDLARAAGARELAGGIRNRALSLARAGVATHEPLVAALKATAALDRGDPARALDLVEEAWPPPVGERWGYLDLVRAEALERAGAHDSALVQWQRITASRWVGWEVEDNWNQADLHVARLAWRLGRTAEAVAALDRLLERWSAGDPDAPAMLQALRLRSQILTESRPSGSGAPAGQP